MNGGSMNVGAAAPADTGHRGAYACPDAHEFTATEDRRSGTPLMFCVRCGLVQEIAVAKPEEKENE